MCKSWNSAQIEGKTNVQEKERERKIDRGTERQRMTETEISNKT
jgi:hypothetical protein